ncbi:hypothetical protein F4677DRAFT_418073 [Hypoxylon crocopeplum]|nr:hypothetical protein F4677DRAFT_418073 [Hypoxylon crocopeplum]
MFNDITKPPPPLPSIQYEELAPGIGLLLPLSRRGHGPGLITLVADTTDQLTIAEGVPSTLIKWAEEGYAVVEIQQRAFSPAALKRALEALSHTDKCEPKGKVGLVLYDPQLWNQIAPVLAENPDIVAAVSYANASQESSLVSAPIPTVHHLAGKAPDGAKSRRNDSLTIYYYSGAESYKFATPFQISFHYATEAVSHTRSLTLLKNTMGGPFFDLETIWEEHTYYEFADRSVEHTMSTMVQEPYVNHVPTMTGGIGRESLTSFYQQNFIFSNSDDAELELVSRTIGIDRVVDEFIFKCTHDREIDWLLPGVPPTGKKVEIPMTAVVNVRGDRLYHEHILWDQATVLRQLGLMPEYLPFPYPLPGGPPAAPGGQFEYRVPTAGITTAQKLRERNSAPSNEMFNFKPRGH